MDRKDFSEEIKSLLDTEPIFDDIENEHDTAQLAIKFDEVDLNKSDNQLFSRIRRNQILKLSSFDKRYEGKKIKRQEFIESNYENNKDKQNKEEENFDEEYEYEVNNDNEPRSSEESYNEEDNSVTINKNDANLNILNSYHDETKLKATSVKNQLTIYESLVGLRIKLQKLITISNRFPSRKNFSILKNEQNEILLSQAIKALQKLQNIYLEMDEYFTIKNGKFENVKRVKRKSVDEYSKMLSKRFCSLKEYYPEVMDEWYKKTKYIQTNLNLNKFKALELLPSKSIEQILMDKKRLINRTRIKRSQYNIVGEGDNSTNGDLNEQIFDDDDFYHIILRQIIENKLNVSQDLFSSSKKLAELQRFRSKSKKIIDTKASKGRKIRYNVHEKLINFMAPLDNTTIANEAKNDLFNSLFGNFPIESAI